MVLVLHLLPPVLDSLPSLSDRPNLGSSFFLKHLLPLTLIKLYPPVAIFGFLSVVPYGRFLSLTLIRFRQEMSITKISECLGDLVSEGGDPPMEVGGVEGEVVPAGSIVAAREVKRKERDLA